MTFPWITEAQRRKEEADEAEARKAVFRLQYQQHVDRVNRATDEEINAAMAEIHRKQRKLNVLRPARRAARAEE